MLKKEAEISSNESQNRDIDNCSKQNQTNWEELQNRSGSDTMLGILKQKEIEG